jgi:regulator of protease activity HflC (stomatin/prohibitin superfamily)
LSSRPSRRSYEDEDVPFSAKLIAVAVLAVIFVIFSMIIFALTTTRVSAGEVCVQTRFGKVQEVLTPGLHYSNTFTMNETCYSKRIKIYEVSLSEDAPTTSKADYSDFPIGARSNDAVDMSVALSVQYHVDTGAIVNSYEQGFRSMNELNEKIVKYHVRTIVPQVLSKYTAEQLYVGDLVTASNEIRTLLAEKTQAQGVYIDAFELKRPLFTPEFTDKMKQRAVNAEITKAKAAEQEIAKAEATRLKIEAEGQAKAKEAEAQGDANSTLIRANAQAEAEAIVLEKRAEQLALHPELITWHQIDTIESANVIYLPSDVLPILPMTPNATPTPTP